MERTRDYLLGINTRRVAIARRLNVLLIGLLQAGGGAILYNTDITRGTPLMIEQSGIVSMRTFALFMLATGILTIILGIWALKHLDAMRVAILTTPFILYVLFTIYGVTHGQQSGQGAFIYLILYLIVMVGVWGTD